MAGAAKWGATCAACGHKYQWTGDMMPVPGCPECIRRAKAEANVAAQRAALKARPALIEPAKPVLTEAAEHALSLASQIESDASELPDRASDFGCSVTEKAASIARSVEDRGDASEGQILALENMLAGIHRWLERA